VPAPTYGNIGTVNSTTGATKNVDVPDNVDGVNDLILIFESISNGNDRTGVSSNGTATDGGTFAEFFESLNSFGSVWVDWKVPTASTLTSTTYSTPAHATQASHAVAVRVAGADPTAPMEDFNVATGTATTSAATSLLGLPANCLLFWWYRSQATGANNQVSTPASIDGVGSFTEITPTGVNQQFHLAYLAFPAGGDTGSVSATMSTGPDHVVALVAVAPEPPKEGSGTGTWSATGTATGSAVHSGQATGSWSTTGTATGQIDPAGSASGDPVWTATASGQMAPSGSAVGSHTWAGTADGTDGSGNHAIGSWSITGSALGQDSPLGSATGSWSITGVGAGEHDPIGSALGSWSVTGAGSGQHQSQGVASGLATWTGTASGGATRQGSAVGAHAWSGTTFGVSEPVTPPDDPEATITPNRARAVIST
jgi:hypothetical protein